MSIGASRTRRWRLFLWRENALDLQNVIDVVPGDHERDPFEAFFAPLCMHTEVLPLIRRE
jgi:hypothetical protein